MRSSHAGVEHDLKSAGVTTRRVSAVQRLEMSRSPGTSSSTSATKLSTCSRKCFSLADGPEPCPDSLDAQDGTGFIPPGFGSGMWLLLEAT